MRKLPVVLACVVCAACGDREPPFVGTVSRSGLFEYHDQVDEMLCPTLLPLLDQHAQQIGAKVGLIPRPGDPPFRYYKFRDATAFSDARVCPMEAGGCVVADTVYSPEFFHAHELSHAYVFRAWGRWSVGLLNEGEAVALSCSPPGRLQSLPWRDLIALPATTADERAGYVAAGYFVTYLVQRFGWPSLEALHKSIALGAGAAALDRAFAQIYPLPMDQAWAEALAAPDAQPCLKDWQCATTPLSAGEEAPPSCDDQVHRSVLVTGQAGIRLSFHGGNGEITLVKGCTEVAPSWTELTGGLGPSVTHWVSLAPGDYTLAEMVATGEPPTVKFEGYLDNTFLAATCAGTAAVPLDPVGATYIDFRLGGVTGWIGVGGGGGQAFIAYTRGISVDAAMAGVVEVCDSCDAGATCVSLLSAAGTSTVTLGDRSVLHLASAYADKGTTDPGEPVPNIVFSRSP